MIADATVDPPAVVEMPVPGLSGLVDFLLAPVPVRVVVLAENRNFAPGSVVLPRLIATAAHSCRPRSSRS